MRSSTKQTFREIMILFTVILLLTLSFLLLGRLLFGQTEKSGTAEISVRIEDIPSERIDGLRVGDRVLDRGRRAILGTVEEITAEPHLYESAVERESVTVEKKGYSDLTLRIRIEQTGRRRRESDAFYIGEGLCLSTHAFCADGKIVSIRQGGAL